MGLNSVHAFIQTHTRAPTLSLTLSSHILVSSAHMTANILPAGSFHTLKSTVFSASLHFYITMAVILWYSGLAGESPWKLI